MHFVETYRNPGIERERTLGVQQTIDFDRQFRIGSEMDELLGQSWVHCPHDHKIRHQMINGEVWTRCLLCAKTWHYDLDAPGEV